MSFSMVVSYFLSHLLLHCGAVRCRVLQRGALWCSVLQCVAESLSRSNLSMDKSLYKNINLIIVSHVRFFVFLVLICLWFCLFSSKLDSEKRYFVLYSFQFSISSVRVYRESLSIRGGFCFCHLVTQNHHALQSLTSNFWTFVRRDYSKDTMTYSRSLIQSRKYTWTPCLIVAGSFKPSASFGSELPSPLPDHSPVEIKTI